MPRVENVITQKHFFDKVPLALPEIKSAPIRTLEQVLYEDWASTALAIGSVYVPNFSVKESESLTKAYLKASKSKTWRYSLDYWEIVLEDLYQLPKTTRNLPVGFPPQTQNWITDIRSATLAVFEKLKIGGYEPNAQLSPNYPRHLQMTDAVRLMTEFFWSGGVKYRPEASDWLIGHLSFHYWLSLKRRMDEAHAIAAAACLEKE